MPPVSMSDWVALCRLGHPVGYIFHGRRSKSYSRDRRVKSAENAENFSAIRPIPSLEVGDPSRRSLSSGLISRDRAGGELKEG